MPTTLRAGLGRSQIEDKKAASRTSKTSRDEAWPFVSWTEAVAAFVRDEANTDRRFPVILDSNGEERTSISSLEMVQQLANLSTLPSPRRTNTTDRSGSFTGHEVHIIDLDWDEMKLLRARSQYEGVFVWFSAAGHMEPEPRTALAITSVDSDWQRRPWVPWGPTSWATAMEEFSKADVNLEPAWPVLVDGPASKGPVNSPETLQKLLGLPRPPPTMTTRLTRCAGDWTGEEVKIAEINVGSLLKLPRLAVEEEVYIWFPRAEQQRVMVTKASVVKSVRETPLKEGDKWPHWGQAVEVSQRGERTPEIRHPIMISKPGDDNILTAKKLQSLAGLPYLPSVNTTTITDSYYGEDGLEVEVADITTKQLFKLQERVESHCDDLVLFPNADTGKLGSRSVTKVTRIHDKWLESLKWEEEKEGGADREGSSSDSDG